MADITYTIGQPDVTQGTYSFHDSPNSCGYEQTIDVAGVPAFVVHNDVAREFSIFETYDHSIVGIYPVTITTTI